jgi:hypothetical protein
LVQQPDADPQLYEYSTLPRLQAKPVIDAAEANRLNTLKDAYIQAATRALLDNRVGHGDHGPQDKAAPAE